MWWELGGVREEGDSVFSHPCARERRNQASGRTDVAASCAARWAAGVAEGPGPLSGGAGLLPGLSCPVGEEECAVPPAPEGK